MPILPPSRPTYSHYLGVVGWESAHASSATSLKLGDVGPDLPRLFRRCWVVWDIAQLTPQGMPCCAARRKSAEAPKNKSEKTMRVYLPPNVLKATAMNRDVVQRAHLMRAMVRKSPHVWAAVPPGAFSLTGFQTYALPLQ